MDMTLGMQGMMMQNRERVSRAESPTRHRMSSGKDSEVNIGLHKQSLDYTNFMGKMSPLAFHKLQNTASRHDPTPSTKCGAANGDGTHKNVVSPR